MRSRMLPSVLIASVLATGALVTGPAFAGSAPGPADGPACVAMFQKFDVLQWMYPNNKRQYQNRSAQPPVATQAQLVRNSGCLTTSAELAGMERVQPGTVANSGAAIAPTTLHAGVVTNMEDDARARAFFAAHGVQARSIGSAPLGRRIYIGPFTTDGALQNARALAIGAGFASPYPASL